MGIDTYAMSVWWCLIHSTRLLYAVVDGPWRCSSTRRLLIVSVSMSTWTCISMTTSTIANTMPEMLVSTLSETMNCAAYTVAYFAAVRCVHGVHMRNMSAAGESMAPPRLAAHVTGAMHISTLATGITTPYVRTNCENSEWAADR